MPRIPRFGRGEQDAPPEAHAADQQAQPEQTQQLTSGDPLAAPAPVPAGDPAAPPADGLTSGDPLTGTAPAPAEDLLAAAPAEASPVEEPAPPDAAGEVREGDAAEQPTIADGPLWSAPGAQETGEPGEEPTVVTPAAPAVFPAEGAGVAGFGAAGAATAAAVAAGAEQPDAAPAEGATDVEQPPADARPSFRERTRMRRRMRELRRLREIAFRDLGGLTFDLHRFGRDRQDLVAEKLQALEQIDAELRALENALDARRPLVELREPGIAACPRCATLHGTDANFCPGCGTPLRGSVVSEAGPLRVTPVDHAEHQQQSQPAEPQQPAPPS